MSSLGVRIKQIREMIGMSQQQLAQQLGLKTRQSIYEYEAGTSEPNITSLKKLVELSGKSIEWLIYGEDNYDLTIPTVLQIKEEKSIYNGPVELSEDEFKIVNYIKQKPALIPFIIELIELKLKQEQLIKQIGDL